MGRRNELNRATEYSETQCHKLEAPTKCSLLLSGFWAYDLFEVFVDR